MNDNTQKLFDNFDKHGLLPAIAQDVKTGEVLMQAFMNKEAFQKTLDTGFATYFSRSRNKLWKKGEESGHVQKVAKIVTDCDSDCILLMVEQNGVACHTGAPSCFFNEIAENEKFPDFKIVFDVEKTVHDRKINPIEGSYTNYLFNKGVEKICKKIGEEATETVIASIAGKNDEVVLELSDLLYHALVLMCDRGISVSEVLNEFEQRNGKAPLPKYKNQ